MNIGAHVSIAASRVPTDETPPPYPDMRNAVAREVAFGGTCGQLFTTSPRVWQHPEIDPTVASGFQEASADKLEGPWVIHGAYLINLATPDESLRTRSIEALQADIDAAAQLGVEYVNVHLGAHTGAGEEAGLANAANAIDTLSIPDGVTLLVETDAGSGTKLGGDFAHLERVLETTAADLGVCLDTAHTFVAGTDCRTSEDVDDLVAALEASVGLDSLAVVHLNDSKHPLGSHTDEHAHLGEGHIGDEGIAALLNHPDLRDRPYILETPTEDGRSFPWNIEHARSLRT